jgi:hypothetical protein
VTYWLRRRDGEPCLRWSDGGTRGTTSCVGCELPLGPAYGERGAVELAINDEADDGKIEHGGIGLLMADNGQRGGGQEVKPPPTPFIGGTGSKMGDRAALAHGHAEVRAPWWVHAHVCYRRGGLSAGSAAEPNVALCSGSCLHAIVGKPFERASQQA